MYIDRMIESIIKETPEKVEAYEAITKYPLPERIVTYRYKQNQPRSPTNFNDLVTLNLHELIPNILLGKHVGKTDEEIETWIKATDMYGKLVMTEFQDKCAEHLRLFHMIREEDARRTRFVPEKVALLPIDIQLVILEYLPCDTRLLLLETKYPDTKKNMQKWKVDGLKKFYRTTVHDSVKTIREDYARTCLTIHDFKLSITKKGDYINEIFKVIDMYKNAVPRNVEKYHSYKKQAMKLFMSIVHINHVINKPKKKNPQKKEST